MAQITHFYKVIEDRMLMVGLDLGQEHQGVEKSDNRKSRFVRAGTCKGESMGRYTNITTQYNYYINPSDDQHVGND